MFLSVLLALVVFTLLLILTYYAVCIFRSAWPLSRIPGPFPLPIIGNGLEFGFDTVGIFTNLSRLLHKYGYIYRLWLGPRLFVVVSDPKYAEHFLTSNTNISKSINYRFLNPWLGTGLLTSTGSKWKHHRKIITPTFHFKILEEFLEVFNHNGNILIEKLKSNVGEEFDIHKYITLYALDVISETAMGVQMNVQCNKNSEYVTALQRLADIVVTRSFRPWLFPDFIFKFSQLGKKQMEYIEILHNTTKQVIVNRKKQLLKISIEENNNCPIVEENNNVGQKKRLAFLDLLLQYSNQNGQALTDEEIREEVDTFMFEGHDTVSSALGFCILLLAKHPEHQDKVYLELCDIFGESDRDANLDDLRRMKYLECVIKETLRLYPSAPHFVRELDEDMEIDGIHFKAGTNISISPLFMHQNPEYFPEPERFDPDRFSTDVAQSRNPYAYIPFSAGPRNCVGQRFAMLELKSTLSKMIRNYKFSPGTKTMLLSSDLVLRSMGGVFVKIESRPRNLKNY